MLFFSQYDEVFDKMEETKAAESGKKKVIDRKPKYISNLLKQAEVRNQEEERRKERKGTIHILRKHFHSSKPNLITYVFTKKLGFFVKT